MSIVFFYVAWQFYEKYRAEQEEFEVREHIVRNATECLESGNWECAEKSVRALLCDAPHDSNLQLHLAGILYEQERYEECIRYIDSVGVKTPDFEFLRKKSEQLIREMEELGIERSMHFRVEFEGHPSKSDVMEALAVLEVAYDSLCRLFDFRPKNKMSLVLYTSNEYQGMGPRPEWVGAVYDGKLRVPVEMMRYREIYRPVLFHELTHAFIRAMTRSHVPFWVNEGIAQVVDASRTALPRPEGAVPTLDALTAPFVKESRSDNAERLYWYSQRMVERLLARNASFVYFRDFIQSMHKMGDEEALQKFYGVTAAQLLDEVR
ncbi:MAG: hypothetical protein J6P30_08745 [Fibrobacter sp.]|nr:hypothetical protein [Fibrobacter sp.]